jgi:hypothetical protein
MEIVFCYLFICSNIDILAHPHLLSHSPGRRLLIRVGWIRSSYIAVNIGITTSLRG